MATSVSTAAPVSTETFGTTSPVTGAAPTVATDGLPTFGLSKVTVILSAAETRTLSGAGSLQAYEYQSWLGRWVRVPSADITISTSGVRDLEAAVVDIAQFRNFPGNAGNRIQYVPSGVTFSAGSAGVTVTLVGTKAVMAATGA